MSTSPSRDQSPLALLTPTERQALECASRGLSYKETAAEMRISSSTVRTHLHHIYAKLGVADRFQALRLLLGGSVEIGCMTDEQIREVAHALSQSAPWAARLTEEARVRMVREVLDAVNTVNQPEDLAA